MSSQVLLAIVTGILGLLTAGVLALFNVWIGARAGIDENLRSERLELYPKLWNSTAAVSRWPRVDVTRGSLEELRGELRSWYYSKGGLFLSESARARYGDFQELIAAILTHQGDAADVLVEDRYTDLMETASALRSALTEDLDTRRKKSFWENRRRNLQHRRNKRKAKTRIYQAEKAAPMFTRRTDANRWRRGWTRISPRFCHRSG
jgi:hypothetical protein